MSPKIIGFLPKSTVVLAPTKRVVPEKFTPQSAPLQSVTVDLVKFPAMIFVPAWRIPRSNVNTSGVPTWVQLQSPSILVVKSPK